MIQYFIQTIDLTASASAQQATQRQLQDAINAFVRTPKVSVLQVETTTTMNDAGTALTITTTVVYDLTKV